MKQLLLEKLQSGHRKIELERVHRTGDLSPSQLGAGLVERLEAKLEVFSKAKYLNGTNMFINEDFPKAVQQEC